MNGTIITAFAIKFIKFTGFIIHFSLVETRVIRGRKNIPRWVEQVVQAPSLHIISKF